MTVTLEYYKRVDTATFDNSKRRGHSDNNVGKTQVVDLVRRYLSYAEMNV